MAAVGTDKELSDLLDFTAMFEVPSVGGKIRTLGGPEERTGNSSWAPGDQNGTAFNQPRGYSEPTYSDHDGILQPFVTPGIGGKERYPFGMQAGMMCGDMPMPGADTHSNSGLKPDSQFHQGYPRRRPTDEPIDSQPKKRKVPGLPSSVVYPTSGEDYNSDGAGYPTSKPGSVYPSQYYLTEGMMDSWGQSGYPAGLLQNSPHIAQQAPFSAANPQDRLQKRQPLAISPQNYPLQAGDMNGYHSGPSAYGPPNGADSIMANRGAAPGSSGDEIGKALASIYPSESNGASFPSTPPTPVGSVGSPQAIAASQWSRSSAQATPSPSFEGGMQAKVGDSLEEALTVLRGHAVGAPGDLVNLLSSAGGSSSTSSLLTQAFSLAGRMLPIHHEEGAGMTPSGPLLHGHHNPVAPQSSQPEGFNGGLMRSSHSSSSLDIKREDKEDDENSSLNDKSEDERRDAKLARSRTRDQPFTLHSNSAQSDSGADNEDDEDLPPEVKVEREKERRQANNQRERLRVRDINEAFKELGRMCQLQMRPGQDKPQTKLLVLQHAVQVILNLEQQVRGQSERNLNPKAACLKRREEENPGNHM
ncbi:transcription factor E2-alpha-like isoform X4 [Sardina pilchardus]|uniref:transcription factor E2-alpha-like isoform X4 n=1 Tax=Sardina pilchardus TaxID=27697 RepID=UPI002E0E0D95